MNRTWALLLASLLSASVEAQPEWGLAAPLPFGRSDQTATPLGQLIYLAGGCVGAQQCNGGYCSCTAITRNVVAFSPYAPAGGAYTFKAPMPIARYRHISCPLGDGTGMVIFGGRTLTPADATTNDKLITRLDVYSSTTNTWRTLGATYPATVLGSDNSCTTGTDGNIYVMGGYVQDYSASTRTLYSFTLDATAAGGTWRTLAPMPIGLGDFSSALAPNGNIHVIGGYSTDTLGDWACRPLAINLAYSPPQNTWAYAATPPDFFAEKDDALLVAGRLFVMGGEKKRKFSGCGDTDIVALSNVFSFDAASNTWRNETFLPSAIMRTATATLGGVIYLFGGQGPIVDGDFLPLLASVLTYTYNPVPVPWYERLFNSGSVAGAVVGTFLCTALCMCAVQYLRCAERLSCRRAASPLKDERGLNP